MVALVQFAKWPEKGRVKTRLAASLGEQGALDAHLTLTQAVLHNLIAADLPLSFWWDRPLDTPPREAIEIIHTLRLHRIREYTQQGPDLGARMLHALNQQIEQSGAAIIVGSDCPSVDVSYIGQALTALQDHDVVLGPSNDGGFVMIGACSTQPDMLVGIDWGTEHALEQTRQRLDQTGLRHTCLEPRWDVDEIEDWERFQRNSSKPFTDAIKGSK